MWNLDLKRTVPLKQDHVPEGVLRAQKPSCPHCEEVSGKISLRPSRGLHMELVHTDILSVPCGLWEGRQGSWVDLFPWGVSASPINYKDCVFSPAYFGLCSPETTRSSERVFFSWGQCCTGHSECKQLLFPLPSSSPTGFLGTEPQDQTPQGKKAWLKTPKSPAFKHSHWPCPWMSLRGWARNRLEAGLSLSAELRASCNPGLGGWSLLFPGMPFQLLISLISLGKASCWESWCDLRVFDPFPLPCSSGVQRE